jgi:hypothetical protein
MEAKFRPIPITILDFLAILLPGFVWLLLIHATLQVFLFLRDSTNVSPVSAWESIVSSPKLFDPLLATVSILIVSLIVGYSIKPIAMATAGFLTQWSFKFQDRNGLSVREMQFPFNEYFKREQIDDDLKYYDEVVKLLRKKVGCSPEHLYGHQPFGAAKRYLRLVAPTLWEESERMEAEVRMTGAMFLASFYSFILSLCVLFIQIFGMLRGASKLITICWFILSAITTVILAVGFTRLRIREVGYTYVNALIVSGCGALSKARVEDAGNSDEESG